MLKKHFIWEKKVLIKIMISNSFTALKGSGKKCLIWDEQLKDFILEEKDGTFIWKKINWNSKVETEFFSWSKIAIIYLSLNYFLKLVNLYACWFFSQKILVHYNPNVFLTMRCAIRLNSSRFSRHILLASMLAGDSSFGSASIETTDKRIFSTDCTGLHLSELLS